MRGEGGAAATDWPGRETAWVTGGAAWVTGETACVTGGAAMATETTKAAAGTATRALTDFFLAELEKEVGPTRKMLERVPMERGTWQPHEKSMALGGLATHVANLPSWTALTVNQNELDIAPVGAPPYKMEPFSSTRVCTRSCGKIGMPWVRLR